MIAYYNLGLLYIKRGIAEEGIETLRAAYRLNPHDPTPLKRIAEYHQSRENRQGIREAIDVYKEVVEHFNDDYEAIFNLAVLY